MKKFISIVLLLAVLLSCCACSAKTGETAEAHPDSGSKVSNNQLTPEQMYGHIDQTVPTNGVYQIWNADGVKNMVNHPDGTFELLCNIDMQGAVVSPIGTADKPFTGEIKGANFAISNFTLQGGDEESFGFVGVNRGTIRNFLIQNVTFIPGANAKNIGSLVGDNQGTVIRCTVTGTMNVESAPEGAACGAAMGINSGSLANTVVEVDLNVSASTGANVGGIVGTSTGGNVEYTDTNGKLDVTGTNKTVGLFAGQSTDTLFTSCAFVGASNTVDGKLFTNFTGNPDDDELQVAPLGLWRDNYKEPMPENIAALRDTVVQKMYDMGTIVWRVRKNLAHNCKCGQNTCVGVYTTDFTYVGIPYKHGNGTLTSFNYCLDEEGYMNDWVYEMDEMNGYDSYIGSMCSSAASMAWWTVANSTNFMSSQFSVPFYYDNAENYPDYGCIPVGEGWWEGVVFNGSTRLTDVYVNSCTEQEFFQALAQTHRGDLLTNGIEAGMHTVMVADEPVIVRDQQGNINGEKSYLLTHEQTGFRVDDATMTYTTWRINEKNSFNLLRGECYVPVTCEELLTGEMETPECTILDSPDGQLGMTVGTVKANYFLETVTLKITDSKGNVVLDKINFPKAGKFDDANTKSTSLCYIDSYDMAYFCTALQSVQFEKGETYTYTICAHLATGDDFEVKTDSFVFGAA